MISDCQFKKSSKELFKSCHTVGFAWTNRCIRLCGSAQTVNKPHGWNWNWNTPKSLYSIWHPFSSLIFDGITKNIQQIKFIMAICKIGQPIQPIYQQFFALTWSSLKKQQWEFKLLAFFLQYPYQVNIKNVIKWCRLV